MSLSITQMAADLAHMVTDLPTAVIWEGQTFHAVVGDAIGQDGLTIEGITEQGSLSVDYVLSAITGAIEQNDTVTIYGRVYRVSRVSVLPDGLTGHIECVGDEE
jgi:hypothetical protein